MSETLEAKDTETREQYYAVEKMTAARSAILRGCADFLTNRARVDRFRESDLRRAQDAFLELRKTWNGVLDALQSAELALLETEQDALAVHAGKLRQGLAGFNLMTRNYQPVNQALIAFAERLPETRDTVNAAVIGRLMNRVRMGYYPTDPEHIDHILRGIQFPEGKTTNVFDPCCGCGKALRQIAEGHNCFAYGVELDEYRAEEAQTRLHRVGVGSFFHSRVSNEAFHLLFLNPPYLSVVSENGNRTRSEKRFLVESIRNLMMGGILIYEIASNAITCVFADTRVYYNEEQEIDVFVFFDPVITEFYRLAERYESERGIREEDDLFRQEMNRSLESGLYYNSYDYGHRLYDHPEKSHGCRLVLLLGCEFYVHYEVAPGLLDIYEAYGQQVQRLKEELGMVPGSLSPEMKEAA